MQFLLVMATIMTGISCAWSFHVGIQRDLEEVLHAAEDHLPAAASTESSCQVSNTTIEIIPPLSVK